MKKSQSPKNRKTVLIGVFVLAALTIIGLTVVSAVAVYQSKQKVSQSHAAVVNLEGEGVCLPKKDVNGPQTMECSYGLKVAKDTYYALNGFGAEQGTEPVKSGEKVLVSGDLTAPADNEIYDIAGTIQVRSIVKK